MCIKIQYLSCIYLWGIVSIYEKQVYSETLCNPLCEISSCQKSSFQFGLIFSHLGLPFQQKCFLCVKIQYLSCIYLWGIVSILKNKFTVKHFVTLPPMWNLSCQKSSFQFRLIFSHLGLPFQQKCFLCVKIQYLSCIYLWGIVCILKNNFTVKPFVTLPPMWNLSCQKSSFQFRLIFSHLGLPFQQKCFLCVKIQYLSCIYLWGIVCILKQQVYSETLCYSTHPCEISAARNQVFNLDSFFHI